MKSAEIALLEMERQLIAESKRRILHESIPRILKCLDMLNHEQIWQSPGPTCNSIGNLILHTCGNARQWLLSGISGAPDIRKRSEEFKPEAAYSKADLIKLVKSLHEDLTLFFSNLKLDQLLHLRKVQVFEETGLGILIHVIEHMSYHTGQITFYTKFLTGKHTNYYGDLSLE